MSQAETVSITPAIVAEHGLSPDEYVRIGEILGREPNLLELGIFSVMWSEHCSYKSSRKWLRSFPTTGPRVVCGPGENAGVVDIGDGFVAVFKMESHNHPSFIEPYQGAATGVGGILRDVFTMGARPVAILDALRFGSPDHPKTRRLVDGVVAGIAGYGNCIGVPTVGGETTFHPAYNGNILVNAMCVGIAPKDRVFYASATGIGNPVVYVGAKTGRDGIHGATMASAEFSDETEAKRPTVQVGDPFTEKLLLEACQELMAEDVIVAIQDMGAAGLTSSSFEMAARGETGIEMDLDRVPLRETGMVPYEIMLSESQERMLIVLAEGKEEVAHRIFAKWGLDSAVIGKVTDTGRMVLRWHGETVADLPIQPVSGASPVYDRPHVATEPRVPLVAETIYPTVDPLTALRRLLGCPDLASKRWIWQQYDQQVMADTIVGPGTGAAVVRVHGTGRGLAMTADCTPRYCVADPKRGGMQAVAEAWRNLTATGAEPIAITDCLNFGNPEKPAVMGQLVGCIKGMAEACSVLAFPVVSGNVSLYNETDGQAILPTPSVGGVGVIDDLDRMATPRFEEDGLTLILIGECFGWLGASLYLRDVIGREEGAPPPVDLPSEKANGLFVREAIRDGRIQACQDLADGGLLIALGEMCMASGKGATLAASPEGTHREGWLFGEDQGRYLVAVAEDQAEDLLDAAAAAGVLARPIGVTGGDALTLDGLGAISVKELRATSETWLPDYMAGR
ncbi:phosphoribosylformylglycinamidine synthase subunit PurL [Marinivivus vitaminiproducens]|uniref:phosphoribosylformylglycinamidine synthase subunit PurL n=1 Tax=Marinivivus vitaminiproducens TaxID=3035935 RepID=UPI00279EE296|nr:phosphoribosylformylglycinamidine synthase subunit PurL [Geminicoccaceae bacterium SCSIO 64248]